MLTYELANPEALDRHWHLMQESAADYLSRTLALMEITPAVLRRIFEDTGDVVGIVRDGQEVGFYWIEERGTIVHLHALILKPEVRGQGIGTAVLENLIDRYRLTHQAIELGVHEGNPGARTLYERLGFRTVHHLQDLGFDVMQRDFARDDTCHSE